LAYLPSKVACFYRTTAQIGFTPKIMGSKAIRLDLFAHVCGTCLYYVTHARPLFDAIV
jgi:hypothetical protein